MNQRLWTLAWGRPAFEFWLCHFWVVKGHRELSYLGQVTKHGNLSFFLWPMGIDDGNMYLQLCVVKINEIVHIKASKCSMVISYTTMSLTVVITGFGLLRIDDLKTHIASRFSGFCPVTFHIWRGVECASSLPMTAPGSLLPTSFLSGD